MNKKLLALLLGGMGMVTIAQEKGQDLDYRRLSAKEDANYFEIVKNQRELLKPLLTSKSKTDQRKIKQFERWAAFWKDRIYPNGDFPQNGHDLKEWQAQQSLGTKSASWSYLGPNVIPTASVPYYAGMGRLNAVAFNGSNTNVMYVGSPAGGVWKTTDGGSNWTALGDNFPNMGVSDIALHPTNNNIVYVATGDYDGTHNRSVGVIKTTDGGTTWNPTGYTTSITAATPDFIGRLLIDPNNPNTVFSCSRNAIRRTTDGGATWTDVHSVNNEWFNDILYKPGSSTVIYASSWRGKFYKSTNNGASWTQASAPASNRLDIAVTAHDPNLIVSIDQGGVVRKSTNEGASWTTASTISGYQPQGGYNQAIAVSPVNKDLIIAGGVEMHRSTNGGTSFTKYADGYYNGSGGSFYVHSDHHDLKFVPGTNTAFSANDGGLFRGDASGAATAAWTDLSAGLHITQYYNVDGTPHNADFLLMGAQDNDLTHLNGTSTVSRNPGSDGVVALWDHTDNTSQKAWTGSQTGHFWRTTNGFGSVNYSKLDAPFVWELEISTDGNTLYAGLNSDIARSTNGGVSFTNMGSGSGAVEFISIAPSDPNTIYVSGANGVRKTTNGGTFWTGVTLPTTGTVKSIEVHPTNPNEIYFAYSGYGAGNRVYKSTNGGTSFTNVTGSLPNIPMHKILYRVGSTTGELFVATDLGVYYWTSTTNDWVKLGSNLPNVIVHDIEIHYGTNKLRAATFGRGLWEVSITGALGLEDNAIADGAVSLIPNPNNGEFNLRFEGLAGEKEVIVYNVIGRVIKHFKTSSDGEKIDITGASAGMYFVHVNHEGSSKVIKVMVSNK